MKMELIEGSETSAIRTQTPGNYTKENILHKEHGESLKSLIFCVYLDGFPASLSHNGFPMLSLISNYPKKQLM
jgi:hypothetical protein